MTSNQLVELARGIAIGGHAGQLDKGGKPYIGHPARIQARFEDPERKILAWLHDVIEDTDVTLDDLRVAGFDEEIVEQVDALTHRKGESRADYYRRIRRWPKARSVKLRDIDDNSDPARLRYLDEATQDRLRAKYALARRELGGAE